MNENGLEVIDSDDKDSLEWKPSPTKSWENSLNTALAKTPSGETKLPDDVTAELKRFMEKFKSEFLMEAEERVRTEDIALPEAIQETAQQAMEKVRLLLAQETPALSKKEESRLRIRLLDIQDRLSKRADTDNPDVREALANERIKIEKKLFPKRPENLIEVALLDQATIDPETKMNATLFPLTTEKKRAQYATEDAEHEARMKAKQAVDAHAFDLDSEEPPTLSGVAPKKRSLWERLLGRS